MRFPDESRFLPLSIFQPLRRLFRSVLFTVLSPGMPDRLRPREDVTCRRAVRHRLEEGVGWQENGGDATESRRSWTLQNRYVAIDPQVVATASSTATPVEVTCMGVAGGCGGARAPKKNSGKEKGRRRPVRRNADKQCAAQRTII